HAVRAPPRRPRRVHVDHLAHVCRAQGVAARRGVRGPAPVQGRGCHAHRARRSPVRAAVRRAARPPGGDRGEDAGDQDGQAGRGDRDPLSGRGRRPPTLKVADTPSDARAAEPQTADAVAERVMVTAMALNPLVSLDRTQLLAAAGRVGIRALLEPKVLGRVVADVGRELVEIARGQSTRAPEPADKRWADPAWAQSPVYHRLMQGYLAWRAGVHRIVDGVDLDAKSRERGRFALSLVTEALAPTNSLAGNPAALKRAVETRAGSLVAGMRNL